MATSPLPIIPPAATACTEGAKQMDSAREIALTTAMIAVVAIRILIVVEYLISTWQELERSEEPSWRRYLVSLTMVSRRVDPFAKSMAWRLDASMVAGSVAFAAWTQLFVSAASGPATAISGFSLGLLFFSSVVLLAHQPLVGGSINTVFRLRRLFTVTGYVGLVLSMASIAFDILRNGLGLTIVIFLAVILTLREVAGLIYTVMKVLTEKGGYEMAASEVE